MLHTEPLGYNDLYLLVRIQALSLVGLKLVSICYVSSKEGNFRRICSHCFAYISRCGCMCYRSQRDLVNISSHANPGRLATNLPNFEWRWERVKSDGTRRFRWALICPYRFSALSSLPDECVRARRRVAQNTGLTRKFSSERKDGRGARNAKNLNLTVIDSLRSHPFVVVM